MQFITHLNELETIVKEFRVYGKSGMIQTNVETIDSNKNLAFNGIAKH